MKSKTSSSSAQSEPFGQPRFFPANSVIFRAGDLGDGMYVIKSGRVRIEYQAIGQEPRRLATLGPDEFLGEMAVIDNSERSASAIAEEDTETAFFSSEEALHLVGQRPDLSLTLLRNLSGRMRAINQRYFEDMLQQERLAIVGRLMTSVLHDLKNPLAVILMAAHLAGQESMKKEARIKALERIPLQVEAMRCLMTELAEYALGRPTSDMKVTLSCAGVLQSTVRKLQTNLALRKISLALDVRGDLGQVRIDYQRVCRLIELLVDHAASELNEDGGKIIVTGEKRDREIVIEITNYGEGLVTTDSTPFFEPLAHHAKGNNWGLRLAICKRIVIEHGGRIWAKPAKTAGSTLAFCLDQAEPTQVPAPSASNCIA